MHRAPQQSAGQARTLRPGLIVRLAGAVAVGLMLGQLGWLGPTVYSLVMATIEQTGNDHTTSGYVGSFIAVVLRQIQTLNGLSSWVVPLAHLLTCVLGTMLLFSKGRVFRFCTRRVAQWLTMPSFASSSAASASS